LNILDLLKQDGKSPKRVGSSWGGTYSCPCPSCGGNDRFRSFPNKTDGISWLCQQCNKKGGTIKYLMEFRGMSYTDACSYLGVSPRSRTFSLNGQKPSSFREWEPPPPKEAPPVEWQTKASERIEKARNSLWFGLCTNHIREWLFSRGIKEVTIKEASLGVLTLPSFGNRQDWGLPEKLKEDGSPTKLRISPGLVIPYIQDGIIQKINIRSFDPESESKYILLEGSASIPMLWGDTESFIIVESELDGLLLFQEAGDLVSIVALGSATMRPDSELTERLKTALKILVALDSDEAGAQNTQWWLKYFPNAVRLPVLRGKDPTEAYQRGLDLRAWIHAGLQYSGETIPHEENAPIELSDPPQQDQQQLPQVDYLLITDPATLPNALTPFANCNVLAIDTITTGPDPFTDKIRLIQIATNGNPVVILDMVSLHTADICPLQNILDRQSKKILHNGKNDLKFLKQIGINLPRGFFDTMLAAQLLSAGINGNDSDLPSLAKEYLNENLPEEKQEMRSNGDITEYQIACAAIHTKILLRLREVLLSKMKETDLLQVASDEFKVISTVADMELNGMRVDREKWEQLRKKLIADKKALKSVLCKELGNINLRSAPELLAALKKEGFPVENAKRETLAPLAPDHQLIQTIMEYRKATALVDQFANKLSQHVNRKTGRIHPEYRQLGAATGRFSCANPNLQNLPKSQEFRECIIPDPGNKLVVADYSQIELRVLAKITGDKKMTSAYQYGMDLHKLTASLVLNRPLEEITDEERQQAKAVNFGLVFAMGPNGLREYALDTYGVEMSLEDATTFRNAFFESYQGFAEWYQKTESMRSRATRTLSGRRRRLHEFLITKALNSPIQGTAADIMKRALMLLPPALSGIDARIIGCVHDEIILEIETDRADDAAQILKETMEEAGRQFLNPVPVEVDVSIGDNWADKQAWNPPATCWQGFDSEDWYSAILHYFELEA